MSHGATIIRRLAEAGVTYKGPSPTRSHYTCRGQEPRTWLARPDSYGLTTSLGWRFGDVRAGEYTAGNEIVLDLAAAEIARADCLVAYTTPRDPWDLQITTLDGYAASRRMLLPCRAVLWHWRRQRRHPIGCIVLGLPDRITGLVTGVDRGMLVVHIEDQSHGPHLLRPNQVEVKGLLCNMGET